ncbi:MAG: twin-arginine translocase TatA/TatE family subunit [Gammaproteobacteria bacterium]
MELFAPRHLLIILLVVMLVFGTKKLKTLGADLGGAIRGFKQAMKEGESDDHASAAPRTEETAPAAIESPATAEKRPS